MGCCSSATSTDQTSNAKNESLVIAIGIDSNQICGDAEAVLTEEFKVSGLNRNVDCDKALAWGVQGDFNDNDPIKAAVEGYT